MNDLENVVTQEEYFIFKPLDTIHANAHLFGTTYTDTNVHEHTYTNIYAPTHAHSHIYSHIYAYANPLNI